MNLDEFVTFRITSIIKTSSSSFRITTSVTCGKYETTFDSEYTGFDVATFNWDRFRNDLSEKFKKEICDSAFDEFKKKHLHEVWKVKIAQEPKKVKT